MPYRLCWCLPLILVCRFAHAGPSIGFDFDVSMKYDDDGLSKTSTFNPPSTTKVSQTGYLSFVGSSEDDVNYEVYFSLTAGIVSDAVEVVIEGLAGQLLAFGALEELADLAPLLPIGVLPIFVGAWQIGSVLVLERGHFAFVAEDVLAVEGDIGVRELWETVIVHTGCRHLASFFKLCAGPVRVCRIG